MPKVRDVADSTLMIPSTRTKAEIRELKLEVLKLIGDGKAINISEACRLLLVEPSQGQYWAHADEEFHRNVKAMQEVFADTLEQRLMDSNNVIAHIFLLKKLRPEYRDSYRQPVGDSNTKIVIDKLMVLGQQGQTQQLQSAADAANIVEGEIVAE